MCGLSIVHNNTLSRSSIVFMHFDLFSISFQRFECLHIVLIYAELSFLETSALTGENVEEVFLKCARTILTKIDEGSVAMVIAPCIIHRRENLILLLYLK